MTTIASQTIASLIITNNKNGGHTLMTQDTNQWSIMQRFSANNEWGQDSKVHGWMMIMPAPASDQGYHPPWVPEIDAVNNPLIALMSRGYQTPSIVRLQVNPSCPVGWIWLPVDQHMFCIPNLVHGRGSTLGKPQCTLYVNSRTIHHDMYVYVSYSNM